jgi:very-short-patch-repair endonuclease
MTAQNNWTAIKAHYAKLNERIFSCTANTWAADPYAWDMGQHMIFMTPIEENFWADCREADLILYPQYPACGYFIDFANPVAKVGIECDGKAFHVDKERDEYRQGVLERAGWSIFRISGRECNENWDADVAPAGRRLAELIGRNFGIKRSASHSGTRQVGEVFMDRLEEMLSRWTRGMEA